MRDKDAPPGTVFRSVQSNLLTPWRKQTAEELGPEVEGASGASFRIAPGREVLDFGSQYVYCNLGHNNALLKAKLREALDATTIAPDFRLDVREEAARKLAEVAPGDLDRVFFSTSGTEAVEAALKMAKSLTGKPIVFSQYQSYHGSTMGSVSVSPGRRAWEYEPGLPGVICARPCDPYHCPKAPAGGHCSDCGEHCARDLEYLILANGPHRVAAVLIEPILGSNGIIIPGDGYLQTIREICDRYGILLIFDEVMTGFGRTGRWFASEHWSVVPDIMALAKGLTSGYVPGGATVVRSSVAKAWDDKALTHSHTYANHPLTCAAVSASVDLYRQEDLPGRAARLGEFVIDKARELKERHRSIGDVRGMGLFVGMELVRDRHEKTPLSRDLATQSALMERVYSAALERGVYLYVMLNKNVLSLTPPLCVTEEEIDFAMSVVDEILVIADEMAS